ncbi:MAG: FAD-binding domain-containing protein [Gemmatimonadaceae bacterium]
MSRSAPMPHDDGEIAGEHHVPGAVSLRDRALARTDAIDLAQYARSRNALDGHVSHLSPYLTHGVTDVPEVLGRLASRGPLGWTDKFVYELGWRAYAQHVWRALGNGVWREQEPTPADSAAYADAMPEDIVTASTGVAIIDEQIRVLYASGYVHNHARMWIASYVVHLRKVEWRIGAAWMYAHLIDGDLAANTLGWQWVAGTWTGKPYLFNAENVTKFAPGREHRGTIIDATYEEMDALARQAHGSKASSDIGHNTGQAAAVVPETFNASIVASLASDIGLRVIQELPVDFAGELVHPWSLHARTGGSVMGVIVPGFHQQYRWSTRRWRFVLQAMLECVGESTSTVLVCANAVQHSCAHVSIVSTPHPGYSQWIGTFADYGGKNIEPTRAFSEPSAPQQSFSAYWRHVTRSKFQV